MALKPILVKRTWERLNHYANQASAGQGCCIANDMYNETGSSEVFLYQGSGATSVLQVYDTSEDSWKSSRPSGYNPSGNLGAEYAGTALAYTSLGTLGGSTSLWTVNGTTTTIITFVNIVKNLKGTKIRIIAGDNAGYEGTITSNTIGPNSVLTISPACTYPNNIAVIEVYSGSVYATWSQSATTSPPFQAYDIATDVWNNRALPSFQLPILYSIKITSVPQIGTTYDTGVVSSIKQNLVPSSDNLSAPTVWIFATGSSSYQDGTTGFDGSSLNANLVTYASGTGQIYTTGYRLKSNTTYTYTAWFKTGSVAMNVHLYVYNNGFNLSGPSVGTTASWAQYTWTFTTGTVGTEYTEVGFYPHSVGTVYISGLQLEEGSSFTSYMPTTYFGRFGMNNLIADTRPSGWLTNNGATVTVSQTDPLGGTNAGLCTDGASINSTILFGPPQTTAAYNATMTFTVWLKSGTATTCFVALELASSPYTSLSTTFNTTATWAKYTLTGTIPFNGSYNAYLRVGTSGGANEGNVYVAFPQLEYGSVAHDFVATSGLAAKQQLPNGYPLTKLTLTGKNYLAGSLKNYRARFTRPSVINLLTYGNDFTNNTQYAVTGGSSKTGTTLNTPIDNARCDIVPIMFGSQRNLWLKAGTYTFSIVATGSGTFSIYAWNAITNDQTVAQQYTLSATPTKFVYTWTKAADSSYPVVGRAVGDTTTAITIISCQLEYGSTSNMFVPTNANLNYVGGTQYFPIIDNDASSITIPFAVGSDPRIGDTITIEPNGDDMYVSGNGDNALYLYNQRSNSWLSSELIPTKQRGSVPGWEQSACFVHSVPGWSLPTSVPYRQPTYSYTYGDKISIQPYNQFWGSASSCLYECTTPGSTAGGLLSGGSHLINPGDTVTDNIAVFASRFIEQPGRYIYSFRGQSTGTLHIFDITNAMWYSVDNSINFKYANAGATATPYNGAAVFPVGTSYAYGKQYIYINVPQQYGRSLFYRYDIKKNIMEPHIALRDYSLNSTAGSGQRNWVSSINIGNETVTYVYTLGMSQSTNLYRTREVN